MQYHTINFDHLQFENNCDLDIFVERFSILFYFQNTLLKYCTLIVRYTLYSYTVRTFLINTNNAILTNVYTRRNRFLFFIIIISIIINEKDTNIAITCRYCTIIILFPFVSIILISCLYLDHSCRLF